MDDEYIYGNDEEIEEDIMNNEEDKLNELIQKFDEYCKDYQLPLLSTPDTVNQFKKALNIN